MDERAFENTSQEASALYIDAARQGTFVPDKENDELTMALGNPEHPGPTRGTPGSVPWKAGFPDAGGYKSQERRKKWSGPKFRSCTKGFKR